MNVKTNGIKLLAFFVAISTVTFIGILIIQIINDSENIFIAPSPLAWIEKLDDDSFVQINVIGKSLIAEVAKSPSKRAAGLMKRTELLPNRGMLFIFDMEKFLTFWMKNTAIPLDIIFLNSKFKVVNIHKNTKPFSEYPTYDSIEPAMYVLETPAGWADIEPGMQLSIIELAIE